MTRFPKLMLRVPFNLLPSITQSSLHVIDWNSHEPRSLHFKALLECINANAIPHFKLGSTTTSKYVFLLIRSSLFIFIQNLSGKRTL